MPRRLLFDNDSAGERRWKLVESNGRVIAHGGGTFRKVTPGESVSLLMGTQVVNGVVVEDRGLIGRGGKRLYRVAVDVAPGTTTSFEVPETELALAD